jgi:hypothetical protein
MHIKMARLVLSGYIREPPTNHPPSLSKNTNKTSKEVPWQTNGTDTVPESQGDEFPL